MSRPGYFHPPEWHPRGEEPVSGLPGVRLMGVDTLGAKALVWTDDKEQIQLTERCSTPQATATTHPRIEVAEHGVRIGCTFVTAAVIKRLHQEFESFKACKTKVVQP